jgi:CBS domain-containing protein
MARTVREIMTANPTTAAPDTPAYQVARTMKQEDVGSVPVVDGGRLVGIVTDRDLCVQLIAEQKPTDAPVRDFMTGNPQTAGPDSTIHDVAQIMGQHQIRRLPIVENDQLVGIVSLGDLAVDTQSDELKVETLEEISQGTR